MTTYYKITNKEENHKGYQYKDGLNILEEAFNENINNECGKGEFYFTTKEHINDYLHLGVHKDTLTRLKISGDLIKNNSYVF